MQIIVNIRCPNAGREQQQLVCQEMHWHKEKGPAVGDCLHVRIQSPWTAKLQHGPTSEA